MASGDNSVRTTFVQAEAEARWIAARVVVESLATDLVASDWNFAFAASDAINLSGPDEFRPMVNGVGQTGVAGTNNPYGWYTGNFGGGRAGAGTPPTTGQTQRMIISPWFSAPCLNRSDGGTRPVYLVRTCKTATNTQCAQDNAPESYSDNAPTNADQRLFRKRYLQNANGVTDLTLNGGGNWQYTNMVSVEFLYEKPVRTALLIGDSTSLALRDGGWFGKAVRTLSTPSAPFEAVNGGQPGYASFNYMHTLADHLAFGLTAPTDVVIQCHSTNDDISVYGNTLRQGLIMQDIDRAKRLPIPARVYLTSGFPYTVYDAGRNALMEQARTWAKNLAASGVINGYIDCQSAVSNGAGGWLPGMSSDGQHPDQPAAAEAAKVPTIAGLRL